MSGATQGKQPKTVYLKDYQPPQYWVDKVDLVFDLNEDITRVESILIMRRNLETATAKTPLYLCGESLKLISVQLDGKALSPSHYEVTDQGLTIHEVPDSFTLATTVEIKPQENKALCGLYRTGPHFCTQCEAEGFRRITYYPDRSDVMAKFTTTIHADKKKYPVLLSNGNCIACGNIDENRHWVKWVDPFKKPSYLFALVSGDLVAVEDHYVTRSGRLITLKIYVERENQDKCAHAMRALQKAMKWDEETYGREYDLDIYQIVAVNDFNMGAMENKGLNIFNAKAVLASPDTATDGDYAYIDVVVGHEYFHNWSGNRVTCRDWFQLSLKEGFTVFREHHFTSDITKSPVSLIESTRYLRSKQFAQDAGPMAHPVRPESYIEIDNFYTLTVYEKGAEVIRMMRTLLGWPTFRKATDLYFERHDGQAVTTDDFVKAMEDASGMDLTQFKLWYSQAGTPEIEVKTDYNQQTKTYQLTLSQTCPPTPGQPHKKDMHIPISVGLLDKKGKDLLPEKTKVLSLKEKTQTFEFTNIPEKPVVSLLREFSAPVKVKPFLTEEELVFLLEHDSDSFNRWDAAFELTKRALMGLVTDYQQKRPLKLSDAWINAYRKVLEDPNLHPALKVEIFSLPSAGELIEEMKIADVTAIAAARLFMKETIAKQFESMLLSLYEKHTLKGRYVYTPEDASHRRIKNLSLMYLMHTSKQQGVELAVTQWHRSNNMTDSMGALSALSQTDCKEREAVLSEFYDRWQDVPLVVNKWLSVQALTELPKTFEVVQHLVKHPAFDIANPNKVYALLGAFASSNPICFHDSSGKPYQWIADRVIQLDPMNSHTAARLMDAFTRWRKFDTERQDKMRTQMERIQQAPKLSKAVYEVVTKCLEA